MGARTRGIANNILSDGLDATDGLSGALSSSNITNASVTNVTSTPSIGGGFEKVASDPPSPTEGDIWYNTTSNTVKGYVFATTSSSFASGGTYPVTGRQIAQATTSATDGFAFGGVNAVPGAGRTNASNTYDGTTWTATPSVPQGANHAGFGTSTAAIAAGSNAYPPIGTFDNAYSWNGSTWSSANPMNSYNRTNSGAFGTQTAGIVVGGEPANTTTREYDGTSFTAGPATNATMSGGTSAAGGTSTGAALAGNPSTQFEEWTGAAWTSSTASPTQNAYGFAAGQDSDNFISMGNLPGGSMIWNGSAWSTDAVLSTSRGSGAPNSGSTISSALVIGGFNPGTNYNTTEEYTGAVEAAQVKTLG
jgi:hypothetical protein